MENGRRGMEAREARPRDDGFADKLRKNDAGGGHDETVDRLRPERHSPFFILHSQFEAVLRRTAEDPRGVDVRAVGGGEVPRLVRPDARQGEPRVDLVLRQGDGGRVFHARDRRAARRGRPGWRGVRRAAALCRSVHDEGEDEADDEHLRGPRQPEEPRERLPERAEAALGGAAERRRGQQNGNGEEKKNRQKSQNVHGVT